MNAVAVLFHSQVVIMLIILVNLIHSGYAETVNVSRRLVRFDGKPAAGAQVRVLTHYANTVRHPEVEVIADGDGVFSVDLNQEGSAWFATVTAATAMREYPTRDWAGTQGFLIKVRPMVEVSGTLRDSHGNPPDEPVELFARFEDPIDRVWNCSGTDGEAKVGAEGLFNGKLPAGPITLALRGPPQQMGSGVGPGLPPQTLRLLQEVEIPVEGKKGWQLKASRLMTSPTP